SGNGAVGRGSCPSRARRTSKVTSLAAQSDVPSSGAACAGVAEEASGMCPSPQRRPLVASRPTHPAPGGKTSAQACRSPPPGLRAGRAREHAPARQRAEVATPESSREATSAEQRHRQHRRVTTAPAALGEGLLGSPDAWLVAEDVADTPAHLLVQGGEQLQR